jgi:hypothetical protein
LGIINIILAGDSVISIDKTVITTEIPQFSGKIKQFPSLIMLPTDIPSIVPHLLITVLDGLSEIIIKYLSVHLKGSEKTT